ncbi:MAG TPA: hypothetical protein VGQ20_02930 [Acidimicrobiales bacterium]|nr:hypothetical protein [Acidimicrobiales bacterium]
MTGESRSGSAANLWIGVGPDAAMCLDLVLDHIGVSYRAVDRQPGGACAVIDVADAADGERIVWVLRQHLGSELREAAIHQDHAIKIIYDSPAPIGLLPRGR